MIIQPYLRTEFMKRCISLANLVNVSATAENLIALDIIIQHESGWDTGAVNHTDINAKEGHPSVGLAQVIPSTFAAYVPVGLGTIDDPVANVTSAIRYAVSRYKSLQQVPGVVAVMKGEPYRGY